MKYTINELKEWDVTDFNGTPARPVNYQFDGIWKRIEQSFMVLIGKYDVLDWEE